MSHSSWGSGQKILLEGGSLVRSAGKCTGCIAAVAHPLVPLEFTHFSESFQRMEILITLSSGLEVIKFNLEVVSSHPCLGLRSVSGVM